ncbi:MAG: hypothetical protein RIQ52_383 [Pseudomonadota bacterium]
MVVLISMRWASMLQSLMNREDVWFAFLIGFSIPCVFIIVAVAVRILRRRQDLVLLREVWAASADARDDLRAQRSHALAVNLGMNDRTAGELEHRWKDLDQCFLDDFLGLLQQGEVTAFHAFAMQYAQNMAIHDLALLNVYMREAREAVESQTDH